MLYMIAAPLLQSCKIGHSNDLSSAVRRVATYCPAPVHLVAYRDGGRAEERRMHAIFDMYREHNEWFSFLDHSADLFMTADLDDVSAPFYAKPVLRAVAKAGSQQRLARMSGLSQSAISRLVLGQRISAEDAVALERATGIARSEFRPDLWPAAPPASSEVRA